MAKQDDSDVSDFMYKHYLDEWRLQVGLYAQRVDHDLAWVDSVLTTE